MYIGVDLSMEEYVKEFEKLGYTHDEAIELGRLAVEHPLTVCPDEFDKIVEAFCSIPTVNSISAKDLENALGRYQNESN